MSAEKYKNIPPEGNVVEIIPNIERINSVLNQLLNTYRNSGFPYNQDSARVPQDPRHMPRNLNLDPETRTYEEQLEVARFWFADCYYMRGVNDSNAMTVNLASLHESHPEIFVFENAAQMNPVQIENLLLEHHLAVQHKQTSEHWVENAKRMVDRFDGDPLKIFEGSPEYETLVERIRNDSKGNGFKGFQKKMASMLAYYYMSSDLVPYRNYPLPVDFHVIRLSVAHELITFTNLPENGQIPFEATTDFLRGVFYEFAERHNISQLELCDVVWLFSKELCSASPGNSMRQIGKYAARGTELVPAIQNPERVTAEHREAYAKSCGLCPVKDTCTHNVPSARYYKQGIVLLPDPKVHMDSEPTLHNMQEIAYSLVSKSAKSHLHSLDISKANRQDAINKRAADIRKLAQPTLDMHLDTQKEKPSYTRSEVIAALGASALQEDFDRVLGQINLIER